MIIAIKNPAPLGPELSKWGDYHFGASLQRALEARGVAVVQHFWPEWDREDNADAVIVLRGKRRYVPSGHGMSILWVLSHPATVTPEEIDTYTIACLASDTLRKTLADTVRTPLEVLRQCTDTDLFTLSADPGSKQDFVNRAGIVFVANSRNVRRDIVEWALDVGLRPELIGGNWDRFGLAHLVTRPYIDNAELPALYRRARLSLNDHWGDMRYFGMINNRVFDCLASGLPVLSDHFPELHEVCGDGLLYASDAREYWDAVWRCRLRYPEVVERGLRCWERLRPSYSFDARAEQLIGLIENPPNRSTRVMRGAVPPSDPPALVTAMREVEADAYRRTDRQRLRAFHALPSAAGVRCLTESGRLDYLNGGIGPGPWEVFLDMAASQLPADRFDVMILEDVALLGSIVAGESARFLSSLIRSLGASGLFYLMRGGEQGRRWSQLFEVEGLVETACAEGFVLFARPGIVEPAAAGNEQDGPA